jgi:hypothetical protein
MLVSNCTVDYSGYDKSLLLATRIVPDEHALMSNHYGFQEQYMFSNDTDQL